MTDKQQLSALREQLSELQAHLTRIEEAILPIVMGSPHNTVAAEAYNGLRQLVARSAKERDAHLAQLAQMDVVLAFSANPIELRRLVDEWMNTAGLERVSASHENFQSHFEGPPAPGISEEPRPVQPAYIERDTRRIVRMGRFDWVAPLPYGQPEGALQDDNHATGPMPDDNRLEDNQSQNNEEAT